MKFYLMSVVAVLSLSMPSAYAYDWSVNPGDGTQENPYQISTPEQLLAVLPADAGYICYAMTNDIVFDPDDPAHHLSTGVAVLRGSFDGAGYAIRNLAITTTEPQESVGLFSHVQGYSIIRNVTIVNANISIGAEAENVGILCGTFEGREIVNCSVEGTLSGMMTTGGGICGFITGNSFPVISYCTADVTFSNVAIGPKGGICGRANEAVIHRCRAMCRIVEGYGGGGICGLATWTDILFCEATLHFTAGGQGGGIGGICGSFEAGPFNEIFGCSATVDISSTGNVTGAGGLAGFVSGTVTQSSAEGVISVRNVMDVGGFVGSNSATISDCYARVDIEVNDTQPTDPISEYIGGFCGKKNNDRTITNAYAAGTLTLNFTPQVYSSVGGFCGDGYAGVYTECFWDMEKSGFDTGIGGFNTEGLTGKTTAQMQMIETFDDAGWDFEDEPIWAIDPDSYPRLVHKTFSGGSGWPDDPFIIATAENLIELGQSPRYYRDCFALGNDIDLSDHEFTDSVIAPVGSAGMFYVGPGFSGTFDGRGYWIENLTIRNSLADNAVGLFGGLSEGTVKNVSLDNVTVDMAGATSQASSGGLCGFNSGRIERCRVIGRINVGDGTGGGIAGFNHGGIVIDSYFKGQLTGGIIGGVSGRQEMGGIIERCYAACVLNGSLRGGLVGMFSGIVIRNSAWDSELSDTTDGIGFSMDGFNVIDNIIGLNSGQMKTVAQFTELGWSFVGTGDGGNQLWRMCADGLDTPRLSWELSRYGDFACPDGIGLEDLLALAQAWLTREAVNPASFNTAADANADGAIDLSDFAVLSDHWLIDE